MPFSDLLDTRSQDGPTNAQYVPTDAFDIMSEGIPSMALPTSLGWVWDQTALQERNDQVRKRFGKGVKEVTGVEMPLFRLPDFSDPMEDIYSKLDTMIEQGRAAKDTNWDGIKTTKELKDEVSQLGKVQEEEFAKSIQKSSGMASTVAGVGASAISSVITDPINLLTLPFGAGASRGILSAVKMEALLNAGIEAAEIPLHKEWANRVGRKYGFGEAALDVGTAGVGAGALTGIIRGTGPALRKSFEVLDKFASNRALTSEQREAAKFMSRVAHVDEEIPFPDPVKMEWNKEGAIPVYEDVNAHRKAFEETQSAFKTYRDPSYDKIQAEFDKLRTALEAPQFLEEKIPPRPRDIVDFIISKGGISSDEANIGDITRYDINSVNKGNFGRLINKDGHSLDDLREMAVEAGYIDDVSWEGGTQTSTVATLLDKIHENFRGNKVYSARDAEDLANYTSAVSSMRGNDVLYSTAKQIYEHAKERGLTGIKGDDFEKIAERYLNSKDEDLTFDDVLFDFQEAQASRAYARGAAAAIGEPPPANPIDEIEQALDEAEKSDILEVQQSQFDEMVKMNPDEKFWHEGKELTLRQIAAELADDETVATAVKTCSIK